MRVCEDVHQRARLTSRIPFHPREAPLPPPPLAGFMRGSPGIRRNSMRAGPRSGPFWGLPYARRETFAKVAGGALDLGDWGVARTPLCVKKRQLGGVKGKGDNAPYRASIASCEMTPTPAVPSSPVKWPAHGPLRPGRGGYRNIARTSLCVKTRQLGRLMDPRPGRGG